MLAAEPYLMLIRAPSTLLLVLCTVASVHCLLQEQAERYTWHQQFVGKVLQARTDNRPRSRVYVATEKNVVAALSPKDGSIAWRKVFGEGDAISHLEVDSGRVFTLSGLGTMLRAFEADSGQMLWAAPLGGPPVAQGGYPPAGDLVLLRAGEAHIAVVALGSTIQVRTVLEAEVLALVAGALGQLLSPTLVSCRIDGSCHPCREAWLHSWLHSWYSP